MTRLERVFHAITFELLALAMIIPLSRWVTNKDAAELTLIGVGMSLFVVVWNYFYNSVFDRWFGAERQQRGLIVRVLHTLGFEGGVIVLTLPVVAWVLQITWLQALALEAGFLIFFLFYAMAFNYGYDKLQPFQKIRGGFVAERHVR